MLKYKDVSQVGFCEHGNESSVSMKYGEILISRAMVGFQKGFFCVKSRENCGWEDNTLAYAVTRMVCNSGYLKFHRDRGGTVVKVLCYKSEGHWFDSRRCHSNFSLT